MLIIKKHFCFITAVCFLALSSSFCYLWAKETLKSTPDTQKAEVTQEKAPKQDQPQISLNSTKYDVGEVYEGDVITHDFTFKNTGKAQLNIEKVKAG